jgi:hypothetical protein
MSLQLTYLYRPETNADDLVDFVERSTVRPQSLDHELLRDEHGEYRERRDGRVLYDCSAHDELLESLSKG